MPEPDQPKLEMGGQAVIEGVLMRTRHGYSVAVRRATGDVVIRSVPFRPLNAKYPIFKAPFLRGAVSLFEMLAIGIKALHFSAEEAEKGLLEEEKRRAAGQEPTGSHAPSSPAVESIDSSPAGSSAAAAGEPLPEEAASVWGNTAMAALLIFSLAIAVAMMVVLPNLLAELVGRGMTYVSDAAPAGNAFAEEKRPLLYNLISGGFRAVILVTYIALISRMKEIRRVFQYHGAEHKAVFALEKGCPLTVDAAQRFSTFHPRCGTSFLVVVVGISIVVFAFVAWAYAAIWPGFLSLPFLVKKVLILLGHIVALPVVAGFSYEVLKFSAKRCDRGGAWKWLVWPGLQTQRLTTRAPDDSQVRVALLALEAALAIQPGETRQSLRVIPAARSEGGVPLPQAAAG